ncbi:hypothetical protein CPSG_06582 [Coccidioides posadasii str. Silveira]|uniref:Uncharacterized protein n=1 Tax=Coccidioides posadasii (strain RMSCC 757 / Silveira) TaxID=443226 RepID=E9D9P2_COCPS|nr:hypothetical protein CPSG_06582 [Coccidioides posadasii str. Silveira]
MASYKKGPGNIRSLFIRVSHAKEKSQAEPRVKYGLGIDKAGNQRQEYIFAAGQQKEPMLLPSTKPGMFKPATSRGHQTHALRAGFRFIAGCLRGPRPIQPSPSQRNYLVQRQRQHFRSQLEHPSR